MSNKVEQLLIHEIGPDDFQNVIAERLLNGWRVVPGTFLIHPSPEFGSNYDTFYAVIEREVVISN